MWYNPIMQRPKIIRSSRKTVSLSVTGEEEIVIRAPFGVSESYLFAFAEQNAAWIEKRLAAARTSPKLDLSDGASLVLFDEQYLIRTGKSGFSGNTVYLPSGEREEALKKLLKKLALEKMTALTERLAKKYGFRYRSVRISSARGRWGSCSSDRVIAYSFRIAFLQEELCEYVAVHELSHTVCFSHNGEFWEVVGSILPDWKIRRKMLKSSPVMRFL